MGIINQNGLAELLSDWARDNPELADPNFEADKMEIENGGASMGRQVSNGAIASLKFDAERKRREAKAKRNEADKMVAWAEELEKEADDAEEVLRIVLEANTYSRGLKLNENT